LKQIVARVGVCGRSRARTHATIRQKVLPRYLLLGFSVHIVTVGQMLTGCGS